MPTLAILHYLPLEYYPPVTNLIDYLANDQVMDFKNIKVYSCHNVKGRNAYRSIEHKICRSADREINRTINPTNNLSTYRPNDFTTYEPNDLTTYRPNGLITLLRSPFPKETDNSFIRLLKYLHYNLFTLIGLITHRPGNLLYYESYSAWPAYLYTRYFNRRCRIYIHNHEYASKEWYAGTMKQVRYFHQLEKKWLYPRAQWISQTNDDRLQFFQNDHPYLKKEQLRVMPNYPPRCWQSKFINKKPAASSRQPKAIKLVYVGSLSLSNTYIQEFCKWVIQQDGEVLFDIYAYNLHQDTTDYLRTLNTPIINFFDKGIEYNEIPAVLSQYDVGIIFYKAYSENVINCVSNKFYEYLACNLDVWFSPIMTSTLQHVTQGTYPKVLPVNFEELSSFDFNLAIDKTGLSYKPSEFFCEEVYEELVEALKGK